MSAMIFVVSLPVWSLSFFGQQSPAAPYWRSCSAEVMKSAIIDVSYAASRTPILKLIHSMTIVSRFILPVLRTIASADCPFRQDAHPRMALVIARIRRSEQRERADRAQDIEYVNGEKLFSSSSSAQCTEVEYATERYLESPPPVGTKTDKGQPAQRKRHRDFAPRIQVEYYSSSEASSQCREYCPGRRKRSCTSSGSPPSYAPSQDYAA
jgi:hypothetical protein